MISADERKYFKLLDTEEIVIQIKTNDLTTDRVCVRGLMTAMMTRRLTLFLLILGTAVGQDTCSADGDCAGDDNCCSE